MKRDSKLSVPRALGSSPNQSQVTNTDKCIILPCTYFKLKKVSKKIGDRSAEAHRPWNRELILNGKFPKVL